MMLLSGVWFSLEGAPAWLQHAAKALPLTWMLEAARAVMLDGSGLGEVWPALGALAGMALLFLGIAAAGFRWRAD
jgi:ABC-type multidrug transport system permease subunit